MKKILALLLVSVMALGMTACGGKEESSAPTTVGGILLEDFKSDASGSAQEIADRVVIINKGISRNNGGSSYI